MVASAHGQPYSPPFVIALEAMASGKEVSARFTELLRQRVGRNGQLCSRAAANECLYLAQFYDGCAAGCPAGWWLMRACGRPRLKRAEAVMHHGRVQWFRRSPLGKGADLKWKVPSLASRVASYLTSPSIRTKRSKLRNFRLAV